MFMFARIAVRVTVKVLFLGQVKTLAGGGREGFKDGVGKEARFNYPEGVYFDTDHNILYVVEFVSMIFSCRFN